MQVERLVVLIAKGTLKYGGIVYRNGDVFLSSTPAAKHFILKRRAKRMTASPTGTS